MASTVIITGATGSVAIEAVQQLLVSHPSVTIIGTVRNATKTPKSPYLIQLESIAQQYPVDRLVLKSVDLNSLKEVRSFANEISSQVTTGQLPPISAIICNAFTWSLEKGQQFSRDNYESTFQVNHLAHYLLVLKLLPSVDRESGRIVMLGSEVHDPKFKNPLAGMGALLPDNEHLDQLIKPGPDTPGKEHDMGWRRYANSKLANVMFMQSLNQHFQRSPSLNKLTATAMDPGAVANSRAHQIHRRFINKLVFTVMSFLLPLLQVFTYRVRSNADSARDLTALAVGPEYQSVRGYFDGQKPIAPAAITQDKKMTDAIWESCWDWTGMVEGETCVAKYLSRGL